MTWLQTRGLHGEWQQSELFEAYQTICVLSGYRHTPLKHFKEALLRAGCECWQADLNENGKRYRPEMVSIAKPR